MTAPTAQLTRAGALAELRQLCPSDRDYLASLERAAGLRARRIWGDDPVAWCNRFAWGKDFEARPPREYKATLRSWQARFITELAGYQGEEPQRHIILKSRGVGASWATIWYATWLLWARGPAQVLLMSETEVKAWDLMRRHKFVASKLPPELGYPTPAQGDGDNLTSRILPNGSEIHSLSGNPDAIHTYHPTLIVVDEAAYTRADFRAALVGTKADVIVMSTANGLGNPFHELWEDGYGRQAVEWGYKPLFVSWKERGDLTERPPGSPAVISQEYPETPEEAFVASSVNLHRLPDDLLLEPFAVPYAWPVMAVHDPGVDTGGWLWLARVCGDTHTPMSDGDVYVAEEWDSAGQTISEQVAEAKKRAGRLRVALSVIDPSSHTRTHAGDRWLRIADLFAERGIHFTDGSNDVAAGIARIDDAIAGRRVWFSNVCRQAISDVRTVTLDNMKTKHLYACLRYGMLERPEAMVGLTAPAVRPTTREGITAARMAREIEAMEKMDWEESLAESQG